MTTDADAHRLRLAARIMTLTYQQSDAAWLKVIPVAEVVDSPDRIPVVIDTRLSAAEDTPSRRGVQIFLEDHFGDWTPEDSPYSIFLRGAWRPADRAAMERELDRIVAATEAARLRAAEDEEAERANARAEGYPREDRERDQPGVFEDDATLRRWFATELWPGPETRWFVFEPVSGGAPVPAVVAVDDLLIGVLWIQ